MASSNPASSDLTLEEQIKQLTARAEQAERERNEATRKAEEATRKVEEEKRKAEEATLKVEEEKRKTEEATLKVEEEKRKVEEEKRKAEHLQQQMMPLPFLDFVQGMEEAVFSAFVFEQDMSRSASGAATDVSGKMRPGVLRPWVDFPARHTASFHLLHTSLGDRPLFKSPYAIEMIRNNVIGSGRIANELDIGAFIDHVIERPAAAIVTSHLNTVLPDTECKVQFQSNAYGQLTRGPPPAKKSSPSKDLMPDRWVFLMKDEDNSVVILVGEYKAPQKLKAATLERVLSTPPSDAFFDEATRLPQSDVETEATPARVAGHVLVAQVLCQAYHYMIGAGCEYGYIASGDSLVFLRVLNDTPDVLYYHSVRLTVPATRDAEERRRQNRGIRAAHETAVAYIASLCLWASGTTPRPVEWIENVQKTARRWPSKKDRSDGGRLALYQSPSDRGDGSGGDAGGSGSGGGAVGAGPLTTPRLPQQSGPLKRGRSPTRQPPPSGSGGRTATQLAEATEPKAPEGNHISYIPEPPTLPYCTQACLGGLVRGLALDDNCPNVALHRAAHLQNGNSATTATGAHDLVHDGHPLTMATLQSKVLAQVTASLTKDIDCLDKYGCYGRYGVLFKIAVTGYGYTFVAKSVTEENKDVLPREATVYKSIPDLQGYLVPVFLGVINLTRPIPWMCTHLTHMLLLSYAGPSLDFIKKRPIGVDLDAEIHKTAWELEKTGIYNDDVRDNNMAWNAERERIMHFDFDQATSYTQCPEPVTPKVEEPSTTATTPPPKPARSPLLVKTDWNPNLSSNDGYGDGKRHAAKRIRVDRDLEVEDVKH